MPSRLPRLTALALLAFAACTDPGSGTGPQTCVRPSECPTGQLCVEGACTAVPCLGACDPRTQVCDGTRCVAADGFDCASDSSVCPAQFKCTPAGVCQRSCTLDSECPVSPFRSCNPEGLFCGECASRNDCGGTKKVCDASTASCVECTENADCRDPAVPGGRYCDTAKKRCANGCESNDDCPGGLRCQGGGSGRVGRCIECEREDECTTSPRIHCEPTSGLCVECTLPGTAQCLRDCDLTRNKCVECVSNQTCQRNAICDTSGAEPFCVEGCVGGTGGPNCDPEPTRTPICDPNNGARGLCVRCLKDADCPRTKVCDPLGETLSNGTKVPACVTGCRTDSTVPEARCALQGNEPNPLPVDVLCDLASTRGPKGRCVECKANADCKDPNRPTCDTDSGQCRCALPGETCSASAACGERLPSGQVRCNATLTQNFDQYIAFCINKVNCSNGALCRGNDKTLAPVCALKGRGGVNCNNDSGQCPGGMKADTGVPVDGTQRQMCVPDGTDCK